MKSIFPFNSTRTVSFLPVVVFLSILFAISISSTGAWAANLYAANAAELHAALTNAQNNNQDDTIQIARGTYNGNFSYVNGDGYSITVLGGYDSMFCFRDLDPKNTVLDGQDSGQVLYLYNSVGGSITVDGLTIQNGSGTDGAGIYARSDRLNAGDIGDITLTNNIITGNNATGDDHYGGGVHIYSKANDGTSANITITNNAITGNTADKTGGRRLCLNNFVPCGKFRDDHRHQQHHCREHGDRKSRRWDLYRFVCEYQYWRARVW